MKPDVSGRDEQSIILEQASYTNSYSAFVPWANSISFKINSFRYQEQRLSMRIAEDFLANLGFTRDDVESECSMQTYFLFLQLFNKGLINGVWFIIFTRYC